MTPEPPTLTRAWAMPSPRTFTIPPIAEIVCRYHRGQWCDPFAGHSSPAKMRNDLDPEIICESHQDALGYMISLCSTYDGAFYDPPYSPRQAAECYKKLGMGKYTNESYWAKIKDQIARVVRPGGHVISCGWNSNGMGASRGFRLIEVLLVAHGAQHNDTIVTVEVAQEDGGAFRRPVEETPHV